jgi:hypothetical protein
MDSRGRLTDRIVMAALGWSAGLRLEIRVSDGLIAMSADACGVFAVARQGFVRVPATARRWCRLEAGDRMMLAAYPRGGLLVVHPPSVFDAVLDDIHARALGVSRDE